MVREEGKQNGIGIWEVDEYTTIASRLESRIETVDPDFVLDEIIVIGSFGAGYAVPGESDLDVLVFGVFNAPLDQSELSIWQSELAEKIMDGDVLAGFSQVDSLDLYVEDPAHKDQAIRQYWSYEPVDCFYNLTDDTRRQYKNI